MQNRWLESSWAANPIGKRCSTPPNNWPICKCRTKSRSFPPIARRTFCLNAPPAPRARFGSHHRRRWRRGPSGGRDRRQNLPARSGCADGIKVVAGHGLVAFHGANARRRTCRHTGHRQTRRDQRRAARHRHCGKQISPAPPAYEDFRQNKPSAAWPTAKSRQVKPGAISISRRRARGSIAGSWWDLWSAGKRRRACRRRGRRRWSRFGGCRKSTPIEMSRRRSFAG